MWGLFMDSKQASNTDIGGMCDILLWQCIRGLDPLSMLLIVWGQKREPGALNSFSDRRNIAHRYILKERPLQQPAPLT